MLALAVIQSRVRIVVHEIVEELWIAEQVGQLSIDWSNANFWIPLKKLQEKLEKRTGGQLDNLPAVHGIFRGISSNHHPRLEERLVQLLREMPDVIEVQEAIEEIVAVRLVQREKDVLIGHWMVKSEMWDGTVVY
ncbi:hypothetical protein CLOM_g559 [Closterium sp. NIES-68]|nr:hypothetical protein CLOM_g18917 [Closterium sp. NIES-68]GJP40895.1 hypothetical protein CLOM_g559 [Closterium sp. NIES-68]GJP69149.1 hypothetical protein CLOP_g107 [Closterium sp. NIES-67]